MKRSIDLLQGTLDLLILRALQNQPMHGWAVSERIQQISENVLQVNGRKQLEREAENWDRITAAIGRVMRLA